MNDPDIIDRVALLVGGSRETAIAIFREIRRPDHNMVEAGDFELMERCGDAEETWEVMIDSALALSPADGTKDNSDGNNNSDNSVLRRSDGSVPVVTAGGTKA